MCFSQRYNERTCRPVSHCFFTAERQAWKLRKPVFKTYGTPIEFADQEPLGHLIGNSNFNYYRPLQQKI